LQRSHQTLPPQQQSSVPQTRCHTCKSPYQPSTAQLVRHLKLGCATSAASLGIRGWRALAGRAQRHTRGDVASNQRLVVM
jgi:hypothetical protein